MKILVTGHRTVEKAHELKFLLELQKHLTKDDVLITGMAPGVDESSFLVGVDIQCKIIAYLPYPSRINACAYETKQQVLTNENVEIMYTASKYYQGVFSARNRDMINLQPDLVIACIDRDRKWSGTHYQVKLAEEKGIKVIEVSNPKAHR